MTLKTLIPQDMSKAVLLIVLKVFKGLNFFLQGFQTLFFFPCSNWICLQFFAWQKQRKFKNDCYHTSVFWSSPWFSLSTFILKESWSARRLSWSWSWPMTRPWERFFQSIVRQVLLLATRGKELFRTLSNPRWWVSTGDQIDHDSQKHLEDDKDCWNSLEMKASKSSWSKKNTSRPKIYASRLKISNDNSDQWWWSLIM